MADVKSEQVKEVHFFDRWPLAPSDLLDYLQSWTVPEEAENAVLLDATPDYLYIPAAAPRVKALLPDSKFIVVLRDPAARAFSHWSMQARYCRSVHQLQCPPPFAQAIQQEIYLLSANNCSFSNGFGQRSTWNDCFMCNFIWSECDSSQLRDRSGASPCRPRLQPRGPVANGLFAPQIAWWLSFFPPERFLVLTTAELRRAAQQGAPGLADLGNRVVDFMRLPKPFLQSYVQGQDLFGFSSGDRQLQAADLAALQQLTDFFGPSMAQLAQLLDAAGIAVASAVEPEAQRWLAGGNVTADPTAADN